MTTAEPPYIPVAADAFVIPGSPGFATGSLTADLVTVGVPLLEAAKELKGDKVSVWIAGGIKVDGRIIDIDEEQLVLTVTDSDDRYLIDLQAVAVLQVRR